MSDNAIPQRDADDARSDDGPPTDAASDEVKADAAEGLSSDASPTEGSTSDADVQSSTAQVDEPSD